MVEPLSESEIDTDRLSQIDALARRWRELYPRSEGMRLAQVSYDEDFLVRMAYNSNAIEGSTLTLADTEIVYEGEFVPGKPGREQVAARGIFDGAAFLESIFDEGSTLGEEELRDLHERCALDLQPAARGMYRNAPAVIRASRTVPEAPAKIREEMKNLFYRYGNVKDAHPLAAVASFHAAFENIHPFADGNGRTGRLWMNAQLRQRAYPPIAIKVDYGAEYKSGLEAWQADGNPLPFWTLFLGTLEEELERRIDFLSQGPEESGEFTLGAAHAKEALGVIGMLPHVTAKELGEILGLSERQAQRLLGKLKESKLLERRGAKKNGMWIVL